MKRKNMKNKVLQFQFVLKPDQSLSTASQSNWLRRSITWHNFHIFNDAVICAAYLHIAHMLNPRVKNINVDTIESKMSVQQVQFYRLEI